MRSTETIAAAGSIGIVRCVVHIHFRAVFSVVRIVVCTGAGNESSSGGEVR